ncbi:hypothetical protein [Clostridium diolis]
MFNEDILESSFCRASEQCTTTASLFAEDNLESSFCRASEQ